MKPGLYAVTRWPNANEWPDDTSQVLMQEEDGYLVAVDGDPAAPFAVPPSVRHYARPLVVLDPESDEDVRRMMVALADNAPVRSNENVRDTLRALADPRPPEPMGLGAVVRGAGDEVWVRTPASVDDFYVWTNAVGDFTKWTLIDSPEVLSEGCSE